MNPRQPLISVIVPTYDRPRLLAECLDALAAQDYPRERFEVIVVDDGSPEGLEEVCDAYRDRVDLTLLRQDQAGPGVARNTGAARARGTLLAFTDDDCRPAPGWLSALAVTHSNTPTAGIGGRTVNRLEENLCSVTSQVIVDAAYANYNRDPEDASFFASNNLALPARVFGEVGGFAAEFQVASEDRELCDRWRHLGYRLVYAPDATVLHGHHLTFFSFCRQHFRYGIGAWRFHRVRARRGSGSFAQELKFHWRFLALTRRPLARMPWRRGLGVYFLLIAWQVMNSLGFVSGVLRATGPSAAKPGCRVAPREEVESGSPR